jgi:acyl carrier protein
VPIGVPGELWIGGAGVARGYFRREALTAERFVEALGTRWFRSGDLARYRADGDLEYLGRVDQQVKIRGVRVEPGEVEAVLARHPAVGEVAVVARQDGGGERRLVAYVVPRGGEGIPAAELRAAAAERLPEAMVPAAFILLAALPRDANGKLDRRALPAPGGERPELAAAYAAPRTAGERRIAALWSELLGVERVGIHDHFFALGGNSLLVVRLRSRLEKLLGRELSIVELFRHPTVAALAAHLERPAGAAATAAAGTLRDARGADRRASLGRLREARRGRRPG